MHPYKKEVNKGGEKLENSLHLYYLSEFMFKKSED